MKLRGKALIIGVDFVGSKQMQEIRMKLRGKATILMGKNTMIRTCLRQHMTVNEELGLDPSQTNFFQTLNIPTKIVKGTIELTTEQTVCQAGKKITASQAVLLTKMGIKPFEYGMKVVSVYDNGAVFDSAVLDIT